MFHTALFVLHRVDGGQEDIIYFLVDELLHMAVNEFDRVAGLSLCGLLSQPDCFLTSGSVRTTLKPNEVKKAFAIGKNL